MFRPKDYWENKGYWYRALNRFWHLLNNGCSQIFVFIEIRNGKKISKRMCYCGFSDESGKVDKKEYKTIKELETILGYFRFKP